MTHTTHPHELSLITKTNPKSPISEAYRILRTNVQFSGIDKDLKVIVITSSNAGEGKTTTAANMAVTFAQSGKKVLIIDADLRKPTMHKVFKLTSRQGLTSIISRHTDEDFDYVNRNVFPNLDILTCGIIPPNPSELLSSESMRNYLKKAREEYDNIFIDTSPIGNITDGVLLSSMADAVIIVARAGKVSKEAIKRTRESLDKVGANIIGVVLNSLSRHSNNKYYYYYYYGSNASDRSKKKKPKQKHKKVY